MALKFYEMGKTNSMIWPDPLKSGQESEKKKISKQTRYPNNF
jgi:hypothetical protein